MSYTYVDNPNSNLVCCICRTPFIDPCTTRTCYHTFCYECISRAIAVSRQCPIDRCPLEIHDLAPADPVIRNLVDEMMVECPQRELGCEHTCQRILLSSHLKDSCPYINVPCPEAKCDQYILRKDIPAHTHDDQTPTPEATRSNSQASPDTKVDDAPASATNSSLGSGSQITETLQTENALLRLRVSTLEGIVNVMQQELQSIKRALGPWYRPEEQFHSSSDVQAETSRARQHTDAASPNTESQPRSPTTEADPSSARPALPSEITADTDLASYFPPEEEQDVYSPDFLRREGQPRYSRESNAQSNRQRSHSGAQHPTPGAGATTLHVPPSSYTIPYTATSVLTPAAYAPGPSSFASHLPYTSPATSLPPMVVSVPPLDPTMPLPNTLASLHASVTSLAGALGALASTRAQEALYQGEELRGIRAGMHGLRMQLHDMMTARMSARDSSPAATGSGTAVHNALGNGLGVPNPPGWLAFGPRMSNPPLHPPMSITKL